MASTSAEERNTLPDDVCSAALSWKAIAAPAFFVQLARVWCSILGKLHDYFFWPRLAHAPSTLGQPSGKERGSMNAGDRSRGERGALLHAFRSMSVISPPGPFAILSFLFLLSILFSYLSYNSYYTYYIYSAAILAALLSIPPLRTPSHPSLHESALQFSD